MTRNETGSGYAKCKSLKISPSRGHEGLRVGNNVDSLDGQALVSIHLL